MMAYTQGDYSQTLNLAVAAAERGEYAAALPMLQSVYRDVAPENAPLGLSAYGLCLARVEGKRSLGMELCQRATQIAPDDGRHWANLVRMYVLVRNRRKAVETLDDILRRLRQNPALLRVRTEIGYRETTSLRFLSRTNPLNKLYSRTAGNLKRIVRTRRRPRHA